MIKVFKNYLKLSQKGKTSAVGFCLETSRVHPNEQTTEHFRVLNLIFFFFFFEISENVLTNGSTSCVIYYTILYVVYTFSHVRHLFFTFLHVLHLFSYVIYRYDSFIFMWCLHTVIITTCFCFFTLTQTVI